MENRSSNPPGRYRWLIFGLLAVAYLLVYFHRLSPAVTALDMMEDLGTGGTLMGLLASMYFYPYALIQPPGGVLTDAWGPRRSVTLFFGLAGVGSILFGLISSISGALITRALVGLGVGLIFVPTTKILTSWFKPSEFSRMMGFLMALGGVGAYTATTPLALLSEKLGWRGSFVAIGIATTVLAAAIWFLVRDTPEEMGYDPVDDQAAQTPKANTIGLWQGIGMVISTAQFWPLAIWFFFIFGIFFSFGGLWGGPYFQHVYGLSRTETGNVLSMIALAMIIGSPAMSYLSDHVFKSRKKIIIISTVMVLMLSLTLYFYTDNIPIVGLYIWCFVFSIFASAIVVVVFTASKELFPVSISGTAVGFMNIFPFLGAAVMQPVLGWVLDYHSGGAESYTAEDYRAAFLVYVFLAVIGLVASLFIKETFPVPKRTESR